MKKFLIISLSIIFMGGIAHASTSNINPSNLVKPVFEDAKTSADSDTTLPEKTAINNFEEVAEPVHANLAIAPVPPPRPSLIAPPTR
jgi:hypothetical protein